MPIAATLPRSSTRIASEFTSDDSRCEMTITVRPLAIRRMFSLTIASLSGSSALVASSRIRIFGSRIERARDRESLALAAGQIGRPFVDVRLVAARQPVDEFLGAGEPRRPDDLVEGRVRLGGRDVLADRAAEQKILLQHDAKAAAEMAHVVFAHVDAVDLDQALVVGVQPLQAGA